MPDDLLSSRFNRLLEQYVYNVATKIIDQVDNETQARLIKLFNSINIQLPANKSYKAKAPISKQSKAAVKAIKQLIEIHQITIETILSYISRVDKLLEKSQKIIPSTDKNVALIARYLSLKNRYSVSLIKIQALQLLEINKLN